MTDALPLRYTFITQIQILSKIFQKQDLDFVYFISILKSRMVKPKKKILFLVQNKKKKIECILMKIYIYVIIILKTTFLRKQKCVCVLKVFKNNFVFVI